ncbi:NYN domain-containing protein [Accumulibacter sp.]|uniref:NYN domain-containing protein n=1 Tax=Accumulibacter sp. TaxID=2053492 RepID=UPI0025F8E459|nr:NYN domain-containing protein [Accumulibacter sp.]MCP5228590.1 NYN domain-containing protein [Accumulibacter sp.]
MAVAPETAIMALYCDFENVALGVRDAKYDKFDIKPVLERLLLKGSIVVKKAYCDWERYKGFKAAMHEANFELIEIPHLRQSGKNSADIRLVVDALDLCYTKSHVDTFVIISGDSDFSPVVSKLRENAKYVIGVGVKQSTSDLLIANCDEFIFYDDLVREIQRSARRDSKEVQAVVRRSPEEDAQRREELDARRSKAVELAVATFDALIGERGDGSKIWASMLKEAIKRRKPDFNESYYGFRAFGNLLEEAQKRGLLEIGRDEKSGTYVHRSNGGEAGAEAAGELGPDELALPPAASSEATTADETGQQAGGRRKGQGRRKDGEKSGKRDREARALKEEAATVEDGGAGQQSAADDGAQAGRQLAVADAGGTSSPSDAPPAPAFPVSPETSAPRPPAEAAGEAGMEPADIESPVEPAEKPRAAGRRRAAGKTVANVAKSEAGVAADAVVTVATDDDQGEVPPVKKAATRARRPRKPKAAPDSD